MPELILKYESNDDYIADASARSATGKSTVSLENDTRAVHYDGVNVAVKVPKFGDAVYVPTTSVYSAAAPGSGVTEGSATFIAGETVDNAKMTSAGFTAVGAVVSVHGRKATVLWKTGSGLLKFAADAASSSFSIPSSVLSDEEYNKIYVPTLRDRAGRVGFRQCGSTDVLATWLKGVGGSGGNDNWNGGTESNAGDSFFTAKEWGWTDTGPTGNKTVPASYYQAYEDDPATPTESGWLRYLESRKIENPSRYKYNLKVIGKGAEATEVLHAVNIAQGRSYFPAIQFAVNHDATWDSYGQFYNVPGLRRGDWRLMEIDVAAEMFAKIRYSLSGYGRNSDPVNKTLNAMSGQKIELNRNSDECRYWFPFLRSRGLVWAMYPNGTFNGTSTLPTPRRALSVALLEF